MNNYITKRKKKSITSKAQSVKKKELPHNKGIIQRWKKHEQRQNSLTKHNKKIQRTYENSNQKKVGVGILQNINIKTSDISRDKEKQYIMIKDQFF